MRDMASESRLALVVPEHLERETFLQESAATTADDLHVPSNG